MSGHNWFVPMMQALAAGNAAEFLTRNNPLDVREIARIFGTIEGAGLARESRKNWMTIEHPVLGCVQWRSGVTPLGGGASDFLFLRINGKMVLKAWPMPGLRVTNCEWVVGREKVVEYCCLVELMLGTLQHGTKVPMEERDARPEIFDSTASKIA